MLVYDSYQSPLGKIYVVIDENGLRETILTPESWEQCLQRHGSISRAPARCRPALAQLAEYFAGERQNFTIPLSIVGTEFNRRVWQALLAIPFGKTCTYQELASAVCNPRGYRAVGQANRRNPLPIIIPCHRVIGKNGGLTGYLGNKLTMKEYLLTLEGAIK